MAAEPVGRFTSIDKAIRTFIHLEVEMRSLSPASPRSLQLDRTFIDFLVRHGMVEIEAYELLERHRDHLTFRLTSTMEGWSEFGGSRPVALLPDDPNRLVFWSNPNFGQLTGFNPLSSAVVAAYDWMGRNAGNAFLLPALCYLRAIGCDRIFLTDSPGDEGVDCIGRIGGGGLRSTAVLVQVKSSLEHVSGDQFSAMYARYASLPATSMFGRYFEALDVPRERFGSSRIFVVVAQGDFREGARQLAWKAGTLLRPGRMVAEVLGSFYPEGSLDALSERVELPVRANLERNLAPELES